MPASLCITIRFLQPHSHGRRGDGEPEWPPSPLRVFQALVAAAASRWNERARLEYAAAALGWLECQPAPTIVAAPSVPSDAKYRLYVPDNVGDKVAKAWSRGREASIADYRTEKDVRPSNLSGDAVHYLFPIDGSDPEFETHRNTLIDAARSITHLGWGVDMVAGNGTMISKDEAAKLPGELWQPTEGTPTTGLRVPVIGTLKDLAVKHAAFLNRLSGDGFNPVAPLSAFRVVGYRRAAVPPPRRWAAFRLRHPVEDRAAVFSMSRANCVAAMTRNAMARIAEEQGRDKDWIDHYVHGHREKGAAVRPRFSYLPLPSIEHRADRGPVVGAIRRIAIAELIDVGESHLSWTRQMLPGQFLTDEPTGHRRAMLVPLTGGDWVLRQYTAIADTWATVTPIILPGSDEGKFTKAEKLFFKALNHAGYWPEALAELEFRNVSFWAGGDLALGFQRPDYLKKDCWSVYHVRLRWRHPICGPIALGAGRHCGLGIFATLMKPS
jgi:CRISPR-associated protein Csb2